MSIQNEKIKTILSMMKVNIIESIKFEAIYKVLTLIIFVPLLNWMFYIFMYLSGNKYLTNSNFLKFFISKYGILNIVMLFPIAFFIIAIELSLLIVISYYSYLGVKISILQALLKILAVGKKLKKKTCIALGVYLIVLFPLFSIGMSSTLLPKLQIPKFIVDETIKTPSGLIAYILLVAIIFYINIRWIYILHIMVLEGESSFLKAKNKSRILIKNNYVKIIGLLVGTSLIVSIVNIGVLLSWKVISYCVKNYVINHTIFSAIINIGFGFIYIALTITISLVTNLILVQCITNMYVLKVPKEKIIITDVDKKCLLKPHFFINFLNKKVVKKGLIYIGSSLLFIVFFINTLTKFSVIQKNDFKIMAHRGDIYSGVENTKEALSGAISKKIKYAEIDVLESKDGILVVMHDNNLKRLAGINKNVEDLTYSELSKLNLKTEGFSGKISKLEDILKQTKGKISLNIELKFSSSNKKSIKKFVSLIKKYDMERSCIFQSLDYNVVKELKISDPNMEVGYIMYAASGDLEKLDADFYAIEQSFVNPYKILKAHILNKKLYVWTVNDTSDAEKFYKMGADGVITDESEDIQDLITEIKNKHVNLVEEILEYIINILKF